ncbi:MAG: alpha/beta hydrolase [Moraxella sp.]|nr:alpha/beta hydrolase [Moraxella sp.]
MGKLTLPVLLLWGSDDAISPPAVGQFLSKKLPDATLHIITGGKHDFALTHARCVAKHINRYLTQLKTADYHLHQRPFAFNI